MLTDQGNQVFLALYGQMIENSHLDLEELAQEIIGMNPGLANVAVQTIELLFNREEFIPKVSKSFLKDFPDSLFKFYLCVFPLSEMQSTLLERRREEIQL